jgi:hypothetical protein
MLETVALERAEIVRVPELGAQLLEDLPVAHAAYKAHLALEVRAEIVLDRVIVEEGVVHVEKKDRPCNVPHGCPYPVIPYTAAAEAVYAVRRALEGEAP